MIAQPAVSVVMGAYNARRYLPEAIESLLNQTLQDFELIVVDDGSTDDTFTILQRYQAKDQRVRPMHIPHGGIVDAANVGLTAARSEIVARADADDVNLPDRLRRQFDFLTAHPEVVAVGSQMQIIEPFGSPLGITDHKLTHREIEAKLLGGSGGSLPQPTAMLRKSVALQVGGYRHDYPWSEDIDLFLRMAEVGELANLPDVLVKYRIHPGSTNWRHSDIQVKNRPAMLSEAYRRRGRELPPGHRCQNYWKKPVAERYVGWVWSALKDNNVRGARRHAWSALKEAPFSESSWRAAYCALRGH